jgi:hypothetical protein
MRIHVLLPDGEGDPGLPLPSALNQSLVIVDNREPEAVVLNDVGPCDFEVLVRAELSIKIVRPAAWAK